MKIIVTKRVMPLDNKQSYWTWTLWNVVNNAIHSPISRAEYAFPTSEAARRDARKFLRLIGRPDIKTKTSK